VELIEGAEAAVAVTEAVTATAEAATAAELGAATTVAASEAVASAETVAFVNAGLSGMAWLEIEVNPTTIGTLSRTLGNIVSSGQNVIAKHGNKLVVTAYVAEHGARDIYKIYNQYKATQQALGKPLDTCKRVFIQPEDSEGAHFYDADACSSAQ
jgi:hypothetical protein